MTSKERMLIALNNEKPDRVPASVHQWLPYHLNKYLGGMSDFDAFKKFGLDAAIPRGPYLPMDTPDWKIERTEIESPNPGERRFKVTVKTPGGVLENIMGTNPMTDWQITHLLKRKEDLELIEKYMPVPVLDKESVAKDYERVGDDGIFRGGVWGNQAGCWQDACFYFGTAELILEAMDDPDWVHDFLKILWEKKKKFIHESLAGVKFDLIETGGGASSSTVISPNYFKEFCLPYDTMMHDELHAVGHKAVYHTCGGMMPILELIIENHCDASETLTPPEMGGDAIPVELKARIGDKVCLIGGLDQRTYLERGDAQSIRKHVHMLFETYGKNGGYIMSPSDHFFEASVENLQHYADAAKECVY